MLFFLNHVIVFKNTNTKYTLKFIDNHKENECTKSVFILLRENEIDMLIVEI